VPDEKTERFLRLAQYERGFHAGADPSRARRGHTLGNFHSDWKRGFEDGKTAARFAREKYQADLNKEPPK